MRRFFLVVALMLLGGSMISPAFAAAKYHVRIPLLSGTDHTPAKAYGVAGSLIGFHWARRSTF